MTLTLKDRVIQRMEIVAITNAQLAKACKVKQPTSFNWASGKTKNIKGEPLLLAASALGVTPIWLATGTGPKYPDVAGSSSNHRVEASCAPLNVQALAPDLPESTPVNPFELFTVAEWMLLSKKQRLGFEGQIAYEIMQVKKTAHAA